MSAVVEQSLTSYARLRGLLLAGAVGDALGAPVEFMRRAQILERFGPRGITAFAPAYGRLGAITDDTQMTLFTLEGLIRAKVRSELKGICNPASVIHRAYHRWHATQLDEIPKTDEMDGWLIRVPELHSRRAPGTTCLSALAGEHELCAPARNDSKGAGGIMRVAPIGLVPVRSPYSLACEAAGLTHGHITGQVAAGWFAGWIYHAAKGLPPEDAARTSWRECWGQAPELDAALAQAFRLAAGGPSDSVPPALGEGWIAEEAATIALWCVLTAPDPFEALRLSVNIDGDSDTTGTLVGQFMGAVFGAAWIPSAMLAQLELVEVMEALATEAALLFWGDLDLEGDGGREFWDRYPGW